MAGLESRWVAFVVGLGGAAAGFIAVVFAINRLLAPRDPSAEKGAPFECGVDQAGSPVAAQRLRFSVVAMLFVLFDAEAVLLFSVAPGLRGSPAGLIETGAFVLFLAAGLAYAWRKGALEWRQ